MAPITFAILTVSDTCYAKIKQDQSGPKLEERVKAAFPDASIISKEIVPDDKQMIAQYLVQWSLKSCDVILTTGGTGFSPRDVTPEATRSVIDKEAPGLSYAMTSKSLAVTDLAMLSRAVCGIKYQTLIINLPGSVKGATECFEFVKNAIPHAVALLKGNQEIIKRDHKRVQNPDAVISPSKVKLNQVAFRSRGSPYPMLEVPEAQKIIFAQCPKGESTEIIDITESLNRVLAEDVYAKDPLPPFDASIKDGYAVKVSDGAGIRIVRDVVAAGDVPSSSPLTSGEIIRISTGAAVPEGADAVVQVEDTVLVKATPDGSKEIEVEIKVAPKPFQDIRSIGSDIKANELVLQAGDIITAGHIGVLATVGKTTVKVYRRAAVGILSTGNELQPPHEELKPGHIRDSNKLALLNLLKQYGFQANNCGLAKDNPDSVKQTLTSAFLHHDVVVTTGGVSMGEYDVIKKVLIEDFNATIHFGRVNMKPGKPTTFATYNFEGKLKIIFGLPGNPVSAMVTSILFLIPALRHYENNKHALFPKIPVSLGVDMSVDPRPEYVRVHLKFIAGQSILKAYPVGNQISSRLNSFVGANALLLLPSKGSHEGICKAGEIFEASLLEALSMDSE